MPKTTSENYLSFIGHLDRRISLDKTKSREDGDLYYAALSIMSSKLAYENSARIKYVVENHWHMKYLGLDDYWNGIHSLKQNNLFTLITLIICWYF